MFNVPSNIFRFARWQLIGQQLLVNVFVVVKSCDHGNLLVFAFALKTLNVFFEFRDDSAPSDANCTGCLAEHLSDLFNRFVVDCR